MHDSMKRLYEAAALLGVELRKPQSDMGRWLNESPQVIKNWETRGISSGGLQKIQDEKGINASWLRTGIGSHVVANMQFDSTHGTNLRLSKLRDDGVIYNPDSVLIPVMNSAGSMGHGMPLVEEETVVDSLRLTKSWLRSNLPNISNPENLAVISARGDSMAPTFNDGDMLLVDRGVNDIKLDAVYVLTMNEELYIKRIQRRLDGDVIIKSDNPLYDPHIVSNGDREGLKVLGRVVWAWNGKKL